jgi:hypothetical protein
LLEVTPPVGRVPQTVRNLKRSLRSAVTGARMIQAGAGQQVGYRCRGLLAEHWKSFTDYSAAPTDEFGATNHNPSAHQLKA